MTANLVSKVLSSKVEGDVVSVDIGTSSIKLMELDISEEKPKLISAGLAPSPAGAIKNNVIVKPEEVAAVIHSIVEANGIRASNVVTAVPGPSVFTKKVTVGATNLKELDQNLSFEARNYIPHNIDAVRLDYQVLSSNTQTTMDVLLVAVKNEIIDSFVSCIERAGLNPLIMDVDYFALENMFEINYPEEHSKTIALVNVGARYTSVNLIKDGETLFSGDVGVGGRLYTDALCEALQIKGAEAEKAKTGDIPEGVDRDLVTETIERTTEHIASELHRQIGFFWNAAASEDSIESIYLCGGGCQKVGLLEELGAKTGMTCAMVDPFKEVNCGKQFDSDYLAEIAPAMAVSVGLASRRLGDKVHALE